MKNIVLKSKILQNSISTLVGFLSVLMLIYLSFGLVADIYKGNQTYLWEETTAVILLSDIFDDVDSENNDFRPIIVYEYSIGGVQYECDNYRFEEYFISSPSFFWTTESIIEDNRPGDAITIYYDESNPENACIKRGVKPWKYLLVPLPLTIIFWISKANLEWIRKKKNKEIPMENEKKEEKYQK